MLTVIISPLSRALTGEIKMESIADYIVDRTVITTENNTTTVKMDFPDLHQSIVKIIGENIDGEVIYNKTGFTFSSEIEPIIDYSGEVMLDSRLRDLGLCNLESLTVDGNSIIDCLAIGYTMDEYIEIRESDIVRDLADLYNTIVLYKRERFVNDYDEIIYKSWVGSDFDDNIAEMVMEEINDDDPIIGIEFSGYGDQF